jgi:myo-inositol-1(or 4)-monophosphatase
VTDPGGDLDLALDAARKAGALVMRWFRTNPEVRHKGPGQPVTDADIAADVLLREILTVARPTYGWLSEETADRPDRLERQRVWLVDSIDGTRSFIAGHAEFSISIGLAEEGIPIVGVVLNPATDEVYWAVRGAGAWSMTGSGAAQSLRVRAHEEPAVLVASRTEIQRGELDDLLRAAPGGMDWQLEGLGSTAYKLARVAAGGADAFVSQTPKSEWDVCAGALIVEMAGGSATDIQGRPFRYNKPDPGVSGVLATSGSLHQALVSAIALTGSGRRAAERSK